METVKKIRELAKVRKRSLAYLCEKIGVSRVYFIDREKNGGKIPEDKLRIIAEELNTTVAYLKGEGDMASPSQSKETQIKNLEEDLRQAEFWDFDDEQYTLSLNRKKTAENLYDILSKRETRIIAPTVADDDYYKNAFFELVQTLAEKEDEIKELKEKLREKGGV